jgi:peptidoglycan-associated lipoprotein
MVPCGTTTTLEKENKKMRNGMTTLFVAFCCFMMLAAGCAKKDMVKKETPPPDAAVVTPPTTPPPVKQEPVQETPITKETVTVVEDIANLSEDAAASKLFQTIYFEFDAFLLSETARDALAKNAVALKKNKGMKVQIQGHTDERGSDAYNLALGEKRAKAAYDYLITLGVPANRLYVISYGKERPADPGHDEAAWAKNRRDEFVVLK